MIAIIAVLIALLLPAVQQAREAARRSQCQNNLKQIGLALHNYHDVHLAFPAGWNDHGTGWTAMILPQLELTNLYNTLTFCEPGAACNWDADNNNRRACGTLIPVFRCPSLPIEPRTNNGIPNRVPASYRGCASSTAVVDAVNTGPRFKDPAQTDGLFRGCHVVKMGQITDGTSNTIMVGESHTAPDVCQDGECMDYWYSGSPQVDPYNPNLAPGGSGTEFSEFVGSTASRINLVARLKRLRNEFAAGNPVDPSEIDADLAEAGFGSYHTGGAFFTLGDGSVRFISESIDLTLYKGLGSRDKGEVVAEF